jgi:hypothetical protein
MQNALGTISARRGEAAPPQGDMSAAAGQAISSMGMQTGMPLPE